MNPEELWNIVFPCFNCDDGTLPEIELKNLRNLEIESIYSTIRDCSHIVTDKPTYWDIESQSEKHLDDVPNAALLVPLMKAEPFHFCVAGLKHHDIEIPPLGFYIFQDSIAIDYRMGDQWGPKQVFAFFSWLEIIIESTENGLISTSANDGPPHPNILLDAWRKFLFS